MKPSPAGRSWTAGGIGSPRRFNPDPAFLAASGAFPRETPGPGGGDGRSGGGDRLPILPISPQTQNRHVLCDRTARWRRRSGGLRDKHWETRFEPGERLLWQGAPEPGFEHPWKSPFLILVGLPFPLIGIGRSIFGLHRLPLAPTASQAWLAIFVLAMSLPFAGISAFLGLGPIIEACTASRRVRDALSTRSAYVARSCPSRKLKVYPLVPSTALEIEKGKRADTVWFHARQEPSAYGGFFTVYSGFRNIADGERVFRLIQSIHNGETP